MLKKFFIFIALLGLFYYSTLNAKEISLLNGQEISKNTKIKLHPILNQESSLLITLNDPGFTFSSDLLGKIIKLRNENKTKTQFYIKDQLVTDTLSELNISKSDKLFWFSFEDQVLHSIKIIDIKELLISVNDAGGEIIGSISLEIKQSKMPTPPTTQELKGLAYIGSQNILNPSSADAHSWQTEKISKGQNDIKEKANSILPLDKDSERTIKSSEHQIIKNKNYEFIQFEAKFIFKNTTSNSEFEEQMLGYYFKTKNDVWSVYDYYLDHTYKQKPLQILSGPWLKNYDTIFYVSSTGMGDCGQFVLIKKDAAPEKIFVTCGRWGC